MCFSLGNMFPLCWIDSHWLVVSWDASEYEWRICVKRLPAEAYSSQIWSTEQQPKNPRRIRKERPRHTEHTKQTDMQRIGSYTKHLGERTSKSLGYGMFNESSQKLFEERNHPIRAQTERQMRFLRMPGNSVDGIGVDHFLPRKFEIHSFWRFLFLHTISNA